MDLKTFVYETLTQIVDGVQAAKASIAAGGSGAQINPTFTSSGFAGTGAKSSPVEFDVAVTVSASSDDESADKVGVKAGILSVISIAGTAETEGRSIESNKRENVSRIRFSVGLSQPADIHRH